MPAAAKQSYTGTQSQCRERVRRMVSRLLPDYDCGEYPVLVLPRWRREIETGDPRPAWSVAVRHKKGRLIDVYCQETVSEVLFYGGIKVLHQDDSAIRVMPTTFEEQQEVAYEKEKARG